MVRRILLIVSLVSASLLILAGLVYAQDSGPQGIDAPQAVLGTAFTYQGQLKSGGAGVTGACDMAFRLYDAVTVGNPIGAAITQTVAVNAGLFTAQLDFGAGAFQGDARWLEIAVKCSGDAAFTTLSRQALTAAPYALYARGAPWSGLSGVPAGFADGVDDLGSDWSRSGNSGTNPSANFIGTTDNQTLVFKVNGRTAFRLEPVDNSLYSPNVIGGYHGNSVTAGVYDATISGGGNNNYVNRVTDDGGVVGGGRHNQAGDDAGATNDATFAAVGGGRDNTASDNGATVSGGVSNTAGGQYAIVSGGTYNTASNDRSTVGGGADNTAGGFGSVVAGGANNMTTGSYSTVSGGVNNIATSDEATVLGGANNTASGWYSIVAGGASNTADGSFSFAAGHRAEAAHLGSFVWADNAPITFTSSADNQFLIRANGGVGVNTTDTLASGLTVNGRVIAGGTATGVAGTEPFVSRGSASGLSLDDRTGGVDQRWVIYPNNGTLNFWTDSGANGVRASLSDAGVLTINGLGSAGSTPLCRNASNQIATCSSSLRYKDNVSALDLGLDTIAHLRPVTFDWTGTGEHDLGFVAEEVDRVTPLLTTRNAEGQIEGVKYDRVSAVLVKAVQEQQQQIDDLKHQNAELQARLANLDSAMATASVNVFNVLSVLVSIAVAMLIWQQRRSNRSDS